MINYSSDDIDNIIKKASFIGLCFVYAMVLSKRTNKAFNMADFFNETGMLDRKDYSYGVAVAYSSVNLLDFNVSKDILNVVFVNEMLANRVKGEIDKRLINFPDWGNKVTNIESYFGF